LGALGERQFEWDDVPVATQFFYDERFRLGFTGERPEGAQRVPGLAGADGGIDLGGDA
jgi:hypothetical protein